MKVPGQTAKINFKITSTMLFINVFIALLYVSFPYSIQTSQGNTNFSNGVCKILWWKYIWKHDIKQRKQAALLRQSPLFGMYSI